jgi:DNA-directed RNA polymerase specialized sigma24 family protein
MSVDIAAAASVAKKFCLRRYPSLERRGQDWIDETTQETALRLLIHLRAGATHDQRSATNYAIGIWSKTHLKRALHERRRDSWQVDGLDPLATGEDVREVRQPGKGEWQDAPESDWAFAAADGCQLAARIVWTMCDVLDMDTLEVARALRITPHSAQTLAARVRSAIRAAWNEQSGTRLEGWRRSAGKGRTGANRDVVYT